MKILLTALVILVGAAHVAAQREFVSFDNVSGEYKSLSEVHPILVNRGHQTIYLWPQECGEALVSHIVGEYSFGDRKPCPSVTKPIEIKPGHNYHLPALVIRWERGDDAFDENRIAGPGKFTITMSYSFKPVYRKGPPQFKETVSKEFTIVP